MLKFLRRFVAALLAPSLAATTAVAEGRWQQVENKANCVVWNGSPQPNDTVTWTGGCVGGKGAGSGKMVVRFWNDGDWQESSYTGTLQNGKPHDHGVWVGANGNRYEGGWEDGTLAGYGVFVEANGDRYEGEYKDSKPHGKGVWILADGGKYDGDWQIGNWHGRGVFVDADGNRYEGEYKDGKRHGRGNFILANGSNCEGDWYEDELLESGKGWNANEDRIMTCYFDGTGMKFSD